MQIRFPGAAPIALALAVVLATPSAQARLVTRNETSSAVKVCQGALPAFEGALRKRPKAIQNEGSSAAFVTCGTEGRGLSRTMSPNAKRLQLFFVSSAPSYANVTCTVVDAGRLTTNAAYSRTITVAPGNTQDSVLFVAADLDAVSGIWYIPAVSCALPPGVGISHLWYDFTEENGA